MLAVKHLSAFGAFWMQSIQSDLGAYAGLSRVPVTLHCAFLRHKLP